MHFTPCGEWKSKQNSVPERHLTLAYFCCIFTPRPRSETSALSRHCGLIDLVRTMKIINILCTVVLISCFTSIGSSEELKRIVTVVQVKGDVMVKNSGEASWVPAKVSDVMREGYILKTGSGARVTLSVDGDKKTAKIDMSEKSILSFAALTKDSITGMKKTLLDLAIGQVLIKAEKLDTPDSKFEVKTPTSVVGVRGTKFSVKVDAVK